MAFVVTLQAATNGVTLIPLQYVDDLGNPIDLTGMTFRADFKLTVADAVAFTLSSGNGGIVTTDDVNGFFDIRIPAAAAAAGTYIFDMLQTADGDDFSFMSGTLILSQGITT
jgi:hypothetical protein